MRVSIEWKYARDIANLASYLEYVEGYIIMIRDEMNFDSIFTFGKHKDQELEDVIEDDPNYMEWLVENDVVSLTPEVMERLAERKII